MNQNCHTSDENNQTRPKFIVQPACSVCFRFFLKYVSFLGEMLENIKFSSFFEKLCKNVKNLYKLQEFLLLSLIKE